MFHLWFPMALAALIVAAAGVFFWHVHQDTQDLLRKAEAEAARRNAYMQDCIVRDTKQRCLDLWEWKYRREFNR